MKTKQLPSLKYLNECFELDVTCPSGLRWKKRPIHHFKPPFVNRWNGRYAGTAAGNARANSSGKMYFQVGMGNKNNLAHRIVYAIHNNVELSVKFVIDHIDGNSLNNYPDNLRLATSTENSCNSLKPSSNTSGVKGVYYDTPKQLWFGKVSVNGKQYYTQYSKSKEVIINLIQEFREKIHKEFSHNG